ncbi:class B sortase [Paenibacillus sp. P96]|uniref:Class B sortase n=1 Tax=Paenibacillus zeirhizosphaerae TaxID=2987519 RepID=A0ABT9FRT8_9BACL|nr:class B sortase [Paenibacillus sp. P96]MDP4097167.1 class B sortase [Paenibacillus sp. P96]
MITRVTALYRKPVVQKGLGVLWAGIFLFAACRLAVYAADYYTNRQVLAEASRLYHQEMAVTVPDATGAEPSAAASDGEIRPQFRPLLAINPDIVGWLTIDGTEVDYPVVQARDNEFYLTRNYKQEQTRAGSIFLDFRNRVEGADLNTVIYGHRMKDNSMFGGLKKYLDKEYFAAHRTIYYDTLYGSYDLEIFAVYRTTADFNYIRTSFHSEQEYAEFIRQSKQRSEYETGVNVSTADRIVTLSTCDYVLDPEQGRLVVQAKLVERRG